MKNILCITDSMDDCKEITKGNAVYFFAICQLKPSQHNFSFFKAAFENLARQVDLSKIDLIFAEYIESLPIIYFIRQKGFYCPALLIPHTNAYPLTILSYFILLKCYAHPEDIILCGSENAALAYKKMLGIDAKAIATFGIKSYFKPLDRDCCRHALRLPKTKKLLLFTGRFMNDKGLETLLSIYSSLLQHTDQSLQLVISTSHIDPPYYNALAHQTQNTIIYYRLSRDHLIKLYNAADVYVSCALSIFETYGKAPLEAIACGTPVIVPDWDGFPYYITPNRGWLAKVNFMDTPFASPYQFARIDQEDFSQKILNCLRKKQTVNPILPEWAYYDATLLRIRNLIKDHFTDAVTKKFFRPSDRKLSVINKNSFSEGINEFFQYHRIKLSEDLIARSDAQHFLVENYPKNIIILKKLHNEIFMSTHLTREKMTCLEEM